MPLKAASPQRRGGFSTKALDPSCRISGDRKSTCKQIVICSGTFKIVENQALVVPKIKIQLKTQKMKNTQIRIKINKRKQKHILHKNKQKQT